MLSVAICDDEPAVCREIEELLAGQLVRADLDGNTRVFSDGESLVRAYERGEADFQIVFLDIKMQAMNGISAAREIRRYDEKVLIVFITSSAEYVFRGYEVKAFRYILKTELHQVLRQLHTFQQHCLSGHIGSGNHRRSLFHTSGLQQNLPTACGGSHSGSGRTPLRSICGIFCILKATAGKSRYR